MRGHTLCKTLGSKVLWAQARVGASGSGIPRACKHYERADDQCVDKWALEVKIHQTVTGDRNVVQFYSAYFSEVSLTSSARFTLSWNCARSPCMTSWLLDAR